MACSLAFRSGRPPILQPKCSNRRAAVANVRKVAVSARPGIGSLQSTSRRDATLLLTALLPAVAQQLQIPGVAGAITSNPLEFKKELQRRRKKVPESEYRDGPDGLKIYDLSVGDGAEANVGDRVAVHFDVKFRNVTFATSRQGAGVTGGTPLGFDVGQPQGSAGSTLKGLDLGVRGMRVGGLRKLIVPPELAYGKVGYGEIPANATIQIDVELLSIKTSPMGYRTKLVEG